MQIHELTEAGVLQRLKAGVQQAAGAATQAVKDLPAVQTVAQGKATSPQAYAQAQQQRYAKQAAAAAQKLQAQGYKASTVTPVAGQPIKVTANIGGVSANYVKTATGWQNELGQPITNPQSIAYLDSLLPKPSAAAPGTAASSAGSAVMTTPEVDQAIRQLGLSQQQLKAFQAQAQQNPSFVRAFLKRLGLVQ